MTKYGQAAIEAVKLLEKGFCHNPKDAWGHLQKRFLEKVQQAKKGCPKGAFLGLCEEGLIKGVKEGHYCDSIKNKEYAVKAVEAIKHNPELTNNKSKLWDYVVGSNKAQNNQMDVVIALWERGYIND